MAAKDRFSTPPQSDRLVIITGTAGLGYAAAEALVKAGARVVLAGRNQAKGHEAVERLANMKAGAAITFEKLDLASLKSVRDFADRMTARGEPIDVLINNAGIMSPPQRKTTVEGHELQFGVNYLGHFALTTWLLPLLQGRGPSRIVHVTSLAQHHAKLDLSDLDSEVSYSPGRAYCVSKLLQAMFAVELQRRLGATGWDTLSVAAHPGFAGTGLFDTGGGFAKFVSTRIVLPLIGQSAADGALPILFAATAPEVTGGQLYGPNTKRL